MKVPLQLLTHLTDFLKKKLCTEFIPLDTTERRLRLILFGDH